MRDLVVREAMRTMAADAAERFRELIASGEEIPYDVREPGDGAPIPQYVPLTERFVRQHAPALRELDSFGAACAALESADVAGPYLEQLGIRVPPESRRRAELAAVVFLCRLWGDSTDFSLAPDRLAAGVLELEAGADVAGDEIEVIVPLRGLQMPLARLELATATIVRADTVEVPSEARMSEGAGAGWEPTFIAAVRAGAGGDDDEGQPDTGARAVESFRQLVTALRLFKPGGVGLGPHAWARAGGDRWRRIATGAGRPRPGGYRLLEDELGELVAFSRALAGRANAFGRRASARGGLAAALARSISRFEAGLERQVGVEALNDHLLALRFMLEGGGPAQLGLAMRVAALCAEPERRAEVKAVIDRAIAVERELWSGEPAPGGEGAPTPAETAQEVEALARAILKDAACGHLGGDLRATADEILLADGLAVGEGAAEQRGATEEWDLGDEEAVAAVIEAAEREADVAGDARAEIVATDDERDEAIAELPRGEDDRDCAEAGLDELWEDADERVDEPADDGADHDWAAVAEEPPSTEMQVPEPTGRITVERASEPEEEHLSVPSHAHAYDHEVDERSEARLEHADDPSRARELLAARPAERRRIAARVAHLFPAPETTEWDVRELAYDRRRRADVRELRAS